MVTVRLVVFLVVHLMILDKHLVLASGQSSLHALY